MHSTLKTKKEDLSWSIDPDTFPVMAEFEGVLRITKATTSLSQYEQLYSGAYSPLIKGSMMNLLRKPSIKVVDLDRVGDKEAFTVTIPTVTLARSQACRMVATSTCAPSRFCRYKNYGHKLKDMPFGSPVVREGID